MPTESTACCRCNCDPYPISCSFASSYLASGIGGNVSYGLETLDCSSGNPTPVWSFNLTFNQSSPAVLYKFQQIGGCSYRASFSVRVTGALNFQSSFNGTPLPPRYGGSIQWSHQFTRTAEACMKLVPTCNWGSCTGVGSNGVVLGWVRSLSICNFGIGIGEAADYPGEEGYDTEPGELDPVRRHVVGATVTWGGPWADPRYVNWSLDNAVGVEGASGCFFLGINPWCVIERIAQSNPAIEDCSSPTDNASWFWPNPVDEGGAYTVGSGNVRCGAYNQYERCAPFSDLFGYRQRKYFSATFDQITIA